MDELHLEMDAYMPLRDVVFHTLRDAILKGELAPGERLMEMHLATKLGVSRTPIREAIRMLEKEGLAITIPRKGAQVAKMTEKDLEDVLEIREALDALAASVAIKRMTDEAFDRIESTMEAFVSAVKTEDVRTITEADEDFHNAIYSATENPKLMTIIQNLKEQMYRYRYEYIKDEADYDTLIEEHQGIVDGLSSKDVDRTRTVMYTHLTKQCDAMRKLIRRQEKE